METVADLLARSRRRSLVGRAEELAVLRGFLDDDGRVLAYLHGPGGVGKSALLDAVAGELAGLARPARVLDCADLPPGAAAFAQAVLGGPGDALAADGVLLVDRFELLEPLAPWFWRTFLPSLPADVKVVVAGRRPPHESWRADRAFADHGLVLPVRNLPADAAGELVRARGVADDERVASLVRATRGHPLAIVIATDAPAPAGSRTGTGALLEHPDVAARLLGRFLEEGVTPVRRAALHVCGHARRVDRALLREVLDLDDAGADELLDWLRERPYAESHPDGLTLHDVVRDALEADLRWRDREAFASLHGRVRAVVVDRMTRAPAAEHVRHAADLLHLHRGNPRAQHLYAFEDLGAVLARPLRADDPEELAWVTEAYGDVERRPAATAYWLRAQPRAWTIFEDARGHRAGACMVARLDQAGPDAAEHDPVAGWALRELAARRPVQPGEAVVHQIGLVVAGPGHVGVVSDHVAALSLREWAVHGLGWVVLTSANEASWAPHWSYAGFERLGACAVDGVDVAVWARDFLRGPYAEWLAAMADFELDATGTASPPVAAPVALARADFRDAVRRLLKDLRDPVRLRANPLVDSRLAVPGPDPAARLAERVHQGVAALAEAPRMEPATRALDRTFLRPAGSQEKAAEVLGLPFSTYRRHLATGVERLEALLWDWELHGPPAPDD
ncbi:ATP-binding protein [Frankia sp. CNm7]|uniref:ATP-binding protein n=1 Tax=Frankia nepalensis TaxID=1836974 RepID=A0A937UQ44_9ACTN|nr:ATP-binding protein [Frankia nepalensis]MBL7500636.1 ATP-binding protein [Frankia nepalensis]MBL7511403.1 ATP-binding protein [Frankia nepalensis]MBL7521764.1 ATP-binding protein [Frankia nepalensis]MBL7631499.1 ATP-binding protein [Frankia nepalensis]